MIHVWVFSGSPSGCECCVLCFVVLTLLFGTSLAPRLAGFTVPARSTREYSHGRTFLAWGSGQYSWPAWGAASLSVRAVLVCPRFCRCEVVDLHSPSGSGCLGTRVRSLVHATVGGVSRGSVALVLSLRVFFVKYLLSSWY